MTFCPIILSFTPSPWKESIPSVPLCDHHSNSFFHLDRHTSISWFTRSGFHDLQSYKSPSGTTAQLFTFRQSPQVHVTPFLPHHTLLQSIPNCPNSFPHSLDYIKVFCEVDDTSLSYPLPVLFVPLLNPPRTDPSNLP